MGEPPTIDTGRLRLRPFELSDAPAVQRLAGAPEVAEMTVHIPHPYADGMAEAWIRSHRTQMDRGEVAVFAVTEPASGELVGAIGLSLDPRRPSAELGYWIGKPFWGRGYATEAARAVLRHGFQRLGLRRIHACHFARNVASGRVMQKAGMRRQGEGSRYVEKTCREEALVFYAADSGPVLILARHSLPEIRTNVAGHLWPLSEEGRRRCDALAGTISVWRPEVVVTSAERKAAETGERLGTALDLPTRAAPELHEHDRRGLPFVPGREAFEARMAEVFARPAERAFGNESAAEARRRFEAALSKVIAAHPGRRLTVVAHGTVIALVAAASLGLEPFALWKQLELPSFLVLALPGMEPLTEVICVTDRAGARIVPS